MTAPAAPFCALSAWRPDRRRLPTGALHGALSTQLGAQTTPFRADTEDQKEAKVLALRNADSKLKIKEKKEEEAQ